MGIGYLGKVLEGGGKRRMFAVELHHLKAPITSPSLVYGGHGKNSNGWNLFTMRYYYIRVLSYSVISLEIETVYARQCLTIRSKKKHTSIHSHREITMQFLRFESIGGNSSGATTKSFKKCIFLRNL